MNHKKIYTLCLILAISVIMMGACEAQKGTIEAGSDVTFDIKKVDDIGKNSNGQYNGELWKDSNGCYWIKDRDGGFKQIFEKSLYNSIAMPYCE